MTTNEMIHGYTGCLSEAKGENVQSNAIDSPWSISECAQILKEVESSTDAIEDLTDKLSAARKRVLQRSQPIEELESYLKCIVGLYDRIRELELASPL